MLIKLVKLLDTEHRLADARPPRHHGYSSLCLQTLGLRGLCTAPTLRTASQEPLEWNLGTEMQQEETSSYPVHNTTKLLHVPLACVGCSDTFKEKWNP